MPNICIGSIRVRGYKDNVDEFTRIIQSKYDYYNPNAVFHKPHFWRIFNAPIINYETYGLVAMAEYDIECAWSIRCCMLPGEHTYYNEFLENTDGIKRYGTNILEIGKKLNLDIEIFSYEAGNEFQEHYRVSSGIMTKDECTGYHGLYIGDYDTYEELLDDYDHDDEYLKECGITCEEDFKAAKEADLDTYSPDAIPEDFDVDLESNDLVKMVMCKIVKE
jgi:hypothetical protein